jgi:hypothetical protein
VKIRIHGPAAGYGWDASPALKSWGPDELVEVPDDNPKAVAWAKGWVDNGAELVEDVPAKPEPKKDEPKKSAAPSK